MSLQQKIFFLINNLGKGGAESLVVQYALYLKRRGYDIAVIVLSLNNSNEDYIRNLKDNNINIIDLKSNNRFSPLIPFKLLKAIKNEPNNIFHAHLFPSFYWLAIAKKIGLKGKLIFTEHSNVNNRLNNKKFKTIENFIYNQYDKIIAISPNIQQLLSTWLGAAISRKIIYLPNGIDIKKIQKTQPLSRQSFCEENKIDINTPLIVMPARFNYPKNQKLLLLATAKLKEKKQNIVVLFCGDGSELLKMKEVAAELNILNQVLFLGFRTDIIEIVKMSDIVVLSTHYEGMSGTALEAMAARKPFLGSNVIGVNDIVPDNRYLFDNEESLAHKINEILNNSQLRDSMINDASRAIEKFDFDRIVDEMERMYTL